ncbi:hypothetical protein BHE74_00010862 [Ensete ventricosum]|nr:hypothetical protein BHE74_00010862 [Ensete ventricosum]
MATGWLKSLRCKSKAVEDVHPMAPSSSSSSSTKKPLFSSVVCGVTYHAVEDVVFLLLKHPSFRSTTSSVPKRPRQRTRPKSRHIPRPERPCASPASASMSAGLVGPVHADPFRTLVELPMGDSSRRVVEIIFSSTWSSSGGGGCGAVAAEIEMLFRVHNPVRTVARFEEHRATVRARAARSNDPRCAADGNEMMRFQCGGAGGLVYDAGVARSVVWSAGMKVEGVRTFAGSGGAHASGGGGAGRKAMLVCRVIAGRVRGESDHEAEADSVSLGNGELVVFDPWAVLPCFLIIYNNL